MSVTRGEDVPPAPVPADVDEALLMFQRDMPVLVKDKKGQVGNQKTKYADLVQANEVIVARLVELGCIWTCTPELFVIQGERPETRFVLRWELRHVASKTKREGTFPIKGENPMQLGSGITYARRYALLAVTGVAPEDEDDDGQAFDDSVRRTPASGRARGERPARAAGTTTRRTAAPAGRGAAPALPGDEPAEPVEDVDTRFPGGEDPGRDQGGSIEKRQLSRIQILFGELGYKGDDNRAARLDITRKILRLDRLDTTSDLSAEQADTVIEALVARKRQAGAPAGQEG